MFKGHFTGYGLRRDNTNPMIDGALLYVSYWNMHQISDGNNSIQLGSLPSKVAATFESHCTDSGRNVFLELVLQ